MLTEYRLITNESIEPCTPNEYSFVRGFHALPDLPPVDVYFNDVIRAINFKYTDMTFYMPSALATKNIKIFLTGNKDKPLVDIPNIEIPRGQVVTLAIYGSVDDIKIMSILDNINETVDPDETKIRVYNLDSSPVDIKLSMQNGIINKPIGAGKGTEYIKITPGQRKFEISSSNPSIKPISITLNLKPSRLYTVYITGSVDPNSPSYSQGNIPQIILAADGNSLLTKCTFISV